MGRDRRRSGSKKKPLREPERGLEERVKSLEVELEEIRRELARCLKKPDAYRVED